MKGVRLFLLHSFLCIFNTQMVFHNNPFHATTTESGVNCREKNWKKGKTKSLNVEKLPLCWTLYWYYGKFFFHLFAPLFYLCRFHCLPEVCLSRCFLLLFIMPKEVEQKNNYKINCSLGMCFTRLNIVF